MAEAPPPTESLTIKTVLGAQGPYLDGLVAPTLQVSNTLLEAIIGGHAPYARYTIEQDIVPLHWDGTGIKGPKRGTLEFSLTNVLLTYNQTGDAVQVTEQPEAAHHAFSPFKLQTVKWKPGAVYGFIAEGNREYALNCSCGDTTRLEFYTDKRCVLHGADEYRFQGIIHAV